MNGTLVNSPTYSSSNGGVLVFNGSSQYVGSFVNTSALPASGPYTYEVWFNATSLGSRGFIGYGTYGTNNSVNAFRESGTELLNYWWGNDFSSTSASLATGNWYQAVVTFDGTTRSIYLNGVFLNSQNPGTFYSISNKTNLTVAVTNGSEYFAGSLAIIRMYSAALTQSQIYQNYNATRSRFGSPWFGCGLGTSRCGLDERSVGAIPSGSKTEPESGRDHSGESMGIPRCHGSHGGTDVGMVRCSPVGGGGNP